MKPPVAIGLGALALLLGGVLCYVLMLPAPVPPPPAAPPSPVKPASVGKAPPASRQPPPQAPPQTLARVANLASLPHPEAPATPQVSPARMAARPAPVVGHPDVVTPGSRADYLGDLENVRLMFRDYRSVMGENPVGSNAEIMKSVMGGNPKQAQLGPQGGQGINGNGELVDRWGTPYFFHQVSATTMEIRSAGPDKVMYTSDDLVLR